MPSGETMMLGSIVVEVFAAPPSPMRTSFSPEA
jgi:hypothetical protein